MNFQSIAAVLVITVAANGQDTAGAKALFEQGAAKLQQAGSLAQQGKFGPANELIQAGFAEIDRAVSLSPDELEFRLKRGVAYGSMPPFLNKSAIAREDLQIAVRHPQFAELPQERQARARHVLQMLTSKVEAVDQRPDRFPRVPAELSPLIAAASITFPNARPGESPASMERIMRQLDGYPGLLGKHMVASVDRPGMFIIFTWWKDKKALNDWFYGDLHQGWMKERGRAMTGETRTSASDVPSQVAMEVFAGLPGGVQVNGGFIPREIFASQQR